MAKQWPIQKEGSAGEAVRTIQYLLRARGQSVSVDGIFGPRTEAAVRAFQQAHRLAVDGVVGNSTWMALLITVRRGSQGDAVRAAQSQLVHHGASLQIDGAFGALTESAVRAFQQAHRLAVDGIVGEDTWFAMVSTD
jgi:peptidoglycan hydrolase-like protein with peptidoglycan-binding domain